MWNETKKPLKKVRSGKISVSVWRQKRLRRSDDRATGYVEQYIELERACVQHSVKRMNDEWRNQQIWLNVDELRDLANALDQLNEGGDDSPASEGSVRAHRIIEFIKTNSLDIGLDVYDLQDSTVNEILADIGIHTDLTPSEEALIFNDLKGIVEQQEFAEMAYQVQRCYDPLLEARRRPFRYHTSDSRIHGAGVVPYS